MEVCGRLRKAVDGQGRLWKAVEGCGRLWKAVEGCGRRAPARGSRTMEGCGRLWKAVEGGAPARGRRRPNSLSDRPDCRGESRRRAGRQRERGSGGTGGDAVRSGRGGASAARRARLELLVADSPRTRANLLEAHRAAPHASVLTAGGAREGEDAHPRVVGDVLRARMGTPAA